MKLKPTPAEKKRVIASKDPELLLEFILQIPWPVLRKILEVLPAVKGFRAGRQEELERRLDRFLRELQSAQYTDRVWHMFDNFQAAWCTHHSELKQLLPDYDNLEDFSDAEIAQPNTESDRGCFRYLAKASQEGKVTRETLALFYDFGYFLPDPHIEASIASARGKADQELFEQVSRLSETLRNLQEQVEQAQQIASSASQSFSQLLVDRSQDMVVKGDLDALAQQLNQARLHTQGLASAVQEQAQACAQQTEALLIREGQLVQRLERTELGILAVQSALVEQEEKGRQKESHYEVQDQTDQYAPINSASHHLVPRIRHVSIQPLEDVDNVSDVPTAQGGVLYNIAVLGIHKTSAGLLARDMVVALSAGQMVMLRGSLASPLAIVCAQALAGGHVHVFHIPVGLLDGHEFDLALASVLAKAEDAAHSVALVLEGVNRSAVEAYGHSLQTLVAERILRLNLNRQHLLVFGTIVDGPSSLPLSDNLCQLGPIFDADCLKLAVSIPDQAVIHGCVDCAVWTASENGGGVRMGSSEEFKQLLEVFGFRKNLLWTRALENVFGRLIPTKSDIMPGLQALAFGWIVPRAGYSAFPFADRSDEMRETLELDDESADARLVACLRMLGVEI